MRSKNNSQTIAKLLTTMATLRSESGCPWDKKQTPVSLKAYVLEEAHELLQAIDTSNTAAIRDELGDLLLQVIFLAQIYDEQKSFDFYDVAEAINEKLIRRHPHVFADADPDLHAKKWEEIKTEERKQAGQSHRLADRIPKTLPSLSTAKKLSRKLPPLPLAERKKRLSEILQALPETENGNDTDTVRKSLAESIFQLACLAEHLGIDPEDALRQKNSKVIESLDAAKETHISQQSKSQ